MYQQLSSILEKSLQLHQDLLALAERKRRVVISGQVDGLQTLLKEETLLVEELGKVEQERLQCVKQLVPATQESQQVTLSQLLEQMNDQDRAVIQGQMKELLRSIEQLKYENEQNQTLIQDSLQHVHHTLNVLTTHPGDEYLYNPKQQNRKVTESKGTSGLFDHKA